MSDKASYIDYRSSASKKRILKWVLSEHLHSICLLLYIFSISRNIQGDKAFSFPIFFFKAIIGGHSNNHNNRPPCLPNLLKQVQIIEKIQVKVTIILALDTEQSLTGQYFK